MLKLRRTPLKDKRGLVILTLIYGEQILCCVSGVASRQEFIDPRKDFKGSLRPIPEGLWEIGTPVTLKQREQGVGFVKVPLTPLEKLNNRDGFLFHNDDNNDTRPGSAGCVVFDPSGQGMEKLLGWLPSLRHRLLWVDYRIF